MRDRELVAQLDRVVGLLEALVVLQLEFFDHSGIGQPCKGDTMREVARLRGQLRAVEQDR